MLQVDYLNIRFWQKSRGHTIRVESLLVGYVLILIQVRAHPVTGGWWCCVTNV